MIPWQGYPRPQMRRESYLCLNGRWELEITKDERVPERFSKSILVPFAPESAASGLSLSHEAGEWLHYRRELSLPEGFFSEGSRVILHFGAVDQFARVRINGRLVGGSDLGYLPFSMDITDALEEKNEITVAVRDDLDLTFPYGKQRKARGGMWYTPVSGIWQTVWLECVPKGYIRDMRIEQTAREATLRFVSDVPVERVILQDGTVYPLEGNAVTVRPEAPRNWSPEDPYLYEFTAESACDKVEGYFALREISVGKVDEHARLLLNGKPVFLNALLDQGYYEDGIFLPRDEGQMERDILLIKSLGFNTLRKHIKLEPMQFYHLCDRHGIIVMQDFINNSDYSFLRDTALPTVGMKSLPDGRLHRDPTARAYFIETAEGIQRQLYNCPSVLYYTIFNEGWGQFCADACYDYFKGNDPSRIYDTTSGWFQRKKSDVRSEHIYFKRLKAGKDDGRPFVISEFGGYSLRVEGHTFSEGNYGYKLFGTKDELTDGLVSLYENEVLPLIGKGLCCAVLTQVSDVEDETNGLITYDREIVKVDEGRIQSVMEKIFEAYKTLSQ